MSADFAQAQQGFQRLQSLLPSTVDMHTPRSKEQWDQLLGTLHPQNAADVQEVFKAHPHLQQWTGDATFLQNMRDHAPKAANPSHLVAKTTTAVETKPALGPVGADARGSTIQKSSMTAAHTAEEKAFDAAVTDANKNLGKNLKAGRTVEVAEANARNVGAGNAPSLVEKAKLEAGGIGKTLAQYETKAAVAFKGFEKSSPKTACAAKIGAYSVGAMGAIDGARRMWTAQDEQGKFSVGKFTAGLAETAVSVGAMVATRRITR